MNGKRETRRAARYAGRGKLVARLKRATAIALFALPASLFPLPASRAAAQDVDDGRARLRTGKYQEAIMLLSKVPATDERWPAAQRDLVRAYATIGKYDEAENTARRGTAGKG